MFKDKIVIYLNQLIVENIDNKFKVNAYKKVIKNLKNVEINTIEDTKEIPGIGKSIKSKIEQIINGDIVINIPVNISPIEIFKNIYGIGEVKAKKIVQEHNINTIDELKNRLDLLNNKQKIGLTYYEDLQKRIPRKEMIEHDAFIGKLISEFDSSSQYMIVGSYRREEKTSGDIDVLLTTEKKDFLKNVVKYMKEQNYLIEILAEGEKKFMGIVRLGRNIARRLDIIITPVEEYPYTILYFTGSDEHNIKMRKKALKMGYSLNEHGIKRMKENVPIVPIIKTEEDIFSFLEITYILPKER
jgi:DNA polymerase/3'-5' exonuclease PolX